MKKNILLLFFIAIGTPMALLAMEAGQPMDKEEALTLEAENELELLNLIELIENQLQNVTKLRLQKSREWISLLETNRALQNSAADIGEIVKNKDKTGSAEQEMLDLNDEIERLKREKNYLSNLE